MELFGVAAKHAVSPVVQVVRKVLELIVVGRVARIGAASLHEKAYGVGSGVGRFIEIKIKNVAAQVHERRWGRWTRRYSHYLGPWLPFGKHGQASVSKYVAVEFIGCPARNLGGATGHPSCASGDVINDVVVHVHVRRLVIEVNAVPSVSAAHHLGGSSEGERIIDDRRVCDVVDEIVGDYVQRGAAVWASNVVIERAAVGSDPLVDTANVI